MLSKKLHRVWNPGIEILLNSYWIPVAQGMHGLAIALTIVNRWCVGKVCEKLTTICASQTSPKVHHLMWTCFPCFYRTIHRPYCHSRRTGKRQCRHSVYADPSVLFRKLGGTCCPNVEKITNASSFCHMLVLGVCQVLYPPSGLILPSQPYLTREVFSRSYLQLKLPCTVIL